MKEFMLLIRNSAGGDTRQSPDLHQKFLKDCESYINQLIKEGKLVAAQPLEREGRIISRYGTQLQEVPFDESREVQVGYYHILATDMEEAIRIAKKNPEFEYVASARIEVRPVKMKEASTGFVYPEKLGAEQ